MSKVLKNKFFRMTLCFLVTAVVLEIFVFNFNSIETLFNKEVKEYRISGVTKTGDNSFTVRGESFTVYDINSSVGSVKLDAYKSDSSVLNVSIAACDEANSNPLGLPQTEVVKSVKRSAYKQLHLSGDVKSIEFLFDKEGVTVRDFKLNCKIPLSFSIVRVILIWMLFMILYIIRPKSGIYKITLDFSDRKQFVALVCFIIIQTAFFFGLVNVSNAIKHPAWSHHTQYYDLVDAFLDGNTYLSDLPPQKLVDMENPYDLNERVRRGIDYKWDHAYYNGHYYVYFGVAPAILMYLPYHIITGNDLPTYMGILVLCMAVILAMAYLLWTVIKKWFKNTSAGLYFLILQGMISGSGLLYVAKRPDFYSMPLVMGIFFAIMGLALWLGAEKKDEKGKTALSTQKLFWGALCMALVAGCRPHILLTTVFGIILFFKTVFSKRQLFSKDSIKETVAICLPYVVVGVSLMIYNAVRFGSPFDFGANYNLTSNDMTRRGFVFDRSFAGLFYYFLEPINVSPIFPFVHMTDVKTSYLGLTLTEKMSGGLLFTAPLVLWGIYGTSQKNILTKDMDKRPYIMVIAAVIIGVIIAVMDAQVAGILTRYYGDFAWMVLFASALTVFAKSDLAVTDADKLRVLKTTFVMVIITCTIALLGIFNDVDDIIKMSNPKFYYYFKYLISFWL